MTHFITFFIIIYISVSHATSINHQSSIYNSYYFNLTNTSEWFTNESNNCNKIISCTLQIPSLCIQYTHSPKQYINILYKHISFNFIQSSELENEDISTSRRRLRSARRIPIYRYYKGNRNDHFYTQNAREIGTTRPGRMGRHGYKSEGTAFYLSSHGRHGMVPLYRYWKHSIVDHFYTTNGNEIGTTQRGRTGRHGYKYEAIIGYCYGRYKRGTIPLYRYWKHGRFGDHFYTTNIREIGTGRKGRMGRHGYKSEGITCYVWKSKGIMRTRRVQKRRRRRRRRPKRRRRKRRDKRYLKKKYYKRLYSVGKKIGNIFMDDEKRRQEHEKMMNPFGICLFVDLCILNSLFFNVYFRWIYCWCKRSFKRKEWN